MPARTRRNHPSADSPDKGLAAIRGDFIPLSSCSTSEPSPQSPTRTRSRSPQRRQVDRSVHLHLSLTDSQMETLTNAFSPETPPRHDQAHSTHPTAFDPQHTSPSAMPPPPSFRNPWQEEVIGRVDTPHSRSYSPSKRSRYCGAIDDGIDPALTVMPTPAMTEGRRAAVPSPANVKSTRHHAPQTLLLAPTGSPGYFQPADVSAIPPQTPSPPKPYNSLRACDSPSSVYSEEANQDMMAPSISPLRIQKSPEAELPGDGERRPSLLQDYTDWATTKAPGDGGRYPQETPRILETAEEGSRDIYSPLQRLSQSTDQTPVRRGRKVMVGHNGWLERTGKSPGSRTATPKKVGGILDSLKKLARDVVDITDTKASRRAKEEERDRRTSRLRISLDPREQSLLFCELEFILTSAIHGYINSQFNAGRLDADKYKKISDGWQQKGRPKVVGFRYDLETQLDLIHLHLLAFKFYGDRSGVPTAIGGLLEMMKVNARAMRIRTFCQPDSVIAKQLLDSQSLFNLLGCSEMQQVQLAEVVQFFKTVLEREKHFGRSEDPSTPRSRPATHTVSPET